MRGRILGHDSQCQTRAGDGLRAIAGAAPWGWVAAPRPRAAPTSRRSSAASDGPARSAPLSPRDERGACGSGANATSNDPSGPPLGPARWSAVGATKHRLCPSSRPPHPTSRDSHLSNRCAVVLLDKIGEGRSVEPPRYGPHFAELGLTKIFLHNILPPCPDVIPEMSRSERKVVALVNIELVEHIETTLGFLPPSGSRRSRSSRYEGQPGGDPERVSEFRLSRVAGMVSDLPHP
jgi:hypothetical protein